MQFMHLEPDQLLTEVHPGDVLIGTEQLNRFWKPVTNCALCLMISYIHFFLFLLSKILMDSIRLKSFLDKMDTLSTNLFWF